MATNMSKRRLKILITRHTMDIYEESVELHKKLGGKLSVMPKMAIKDRHDLALAYTPGVAQTVQRDREG